MSACDCVHARMGMCAPQTHDYCTERDEGKLWARQGRCLTNLSSCYPVLTPCHVNMRAQQLEEVFKQHTTQGLQLRAIRDTTSVAACAKRDALAPRKLLYNGITCYDAQVKEYFESDAPTLLDQLPTASIWRGKAGGLLFSVVPELFRGLCIDPRTGVISGQAQVQGAGTFEVTATNALGSTSIRLTLSISPQ